MLQFNVLSLVDDMFIFCSSPAFPFCVYHFGTICIHFAATQFVTLIFRQFIVQIKTSKKKKIINKNTKHFHQSILHIPLLKITKWYFDLHNILTVLYYFFLFELVQLLHLLICFRTLNKRLKNFVDSVEQNINIIVFTDEICTQCYL